MGALGHSCCCHGGLVAIQGIGVGPDTDANSPCCTMGSLCLAGRKLINSAARTRKQGFEIRSLEDYTMAISKKSLTGIAPSKKTNKKSSLKPGGLTSAAKLKTAMITASNIRTGQKIV